MVTGWAARGCKKDFWRRSPSVFVNLLSILALHRRLVPRKQTASFSYFRCLTVLLLCLAGCGLHYLSVLFLFFRQARHEELYLLQTQKYLSRAPLDFLYCVICSLWVSSFDSPFHEHVVIQADRSEWEKLAEEAQHNHRELLKEKLEQRNVATLRQHVAEANLIVGRNPRKESSISALAKHNFLLQIGFAN